MTAKASIRYYVKRKYIKLMQKKKTIVKEKRRQRICILLIIFMLMSEMCSEKVRADFYFPCTNYYNYNNDTLHFKSKILIQDICTQKLLKTSTSFDVYANKVHPNRRTSYRNRLLFQPVKTLLKYQLYASHYIISSAAHSTAYGSLLIIKYIHLQDGEKATQ